MAVDLSCVYHIPMDTYQVLKNGSVFFSWAGLPLPKRLSVNFYFRIHYCIVVSLLKQCGPIGKSEISKLSYMST